MELSSRNNLFQLSQVILLGKLEEFVLDKCYFDLEKILLEFNPDSNYGLTIRYHIDSVNLHFIIVKIDRFIRLGSGFGGRMSDATFEICGGI